MVFLVRLAALLFALVLAEGLAVGHPHGAATVLRLRGAGKNKAAGGNTEGKRSGEEPILCRLKKGGSKWEVACRANKVEAFKEGKIKKSELLLFEEPFQDFKKGDRPSGASIEAAFGTTDVSAVVDEILEKGEFQITEKERKVMLDSKTSEIIDYISHHFHEPKTRLAVPATRIQNGLESIKGLKIDPFRSAESQALEIAKKLKDMFPIVAKDMGEDASVAARKGEDPKGKESKAKDHHKEKGKTDLHKDTEKGGRTNKGKHIVDDAV